MVTAITDTSCRTSEAGSRMKKAFTGVLLLALGLTQLWWPAAGHHSIARKAAVAITHNHAVIGGTDHDCCPKAPSATQVQPLGEPCDDAHRCCISSNDTPALQVKSRELKADSPPERAPSYSVAVSLAEPPIASVVGPSASSRFSTVLRI